MDETFTLLLMDTGYNCVLSFKRNIEQMQRSGFLQVVPIVQSLFDEAWGVFERFNKDKRWSFTDCTSFAVMKQMNIREVFAFDHHFEQMGFKRNP